MEITEKITRECCQHQDLKRYYGLQDGFIKYQFCVHCGQVQYFHNDRRYLSKVVESKGG